MKKLLLHIALISYAAVILFKPVLPYVNDFLGHVLFYTKHMATVHYEHGKYHVHFEAAKDVNEESSNTPGSTSSKKDNSITDHCFFYSYDEPVTGNWVHLKNMSVNNNTTCKGGIKKDDPPPRC